MTVELTAEQEHELAFIASDTQTTPQAVAADAIQHFLSSTAESRAMLARAREQVAAGKTLSHDEVWRRLEERFRR